MKSFESRSRKKKRTNRVVNSYHACCYCKKLTLHIQDHLLRIHSSESDVRQIRNITDEGNDRLKQIKAKMPLSDMLRAKGDHLHNLDVIQKKKGELLLFRRPTNSFNHHNSGPCPLCLSWMMKNSI